MSLVLVAPYKKRGIDNTDPFSPYVTFLMNMDVNPFTDLKSHAITNTAVTLDTSNKKFGLGSAAFNGSAILSTPAVSEFAFGTGDFTVEAWVYPTSLPGVSNSVVGQTTYGVGTNWLLFLNSSGQLVFYTLSGAATTSSMAAPLNAWSHIAAVRKNGVITVYVNGISGGSTSNTENFGSSIALTVGGTSNNNSSGSFRGNVDEVRITRGVSRYNSNFTVPQAAFPAVSALTAWEGLWDETRVGSGTIYYPDHLTVNAGSTHAPRSQNSVSAGSRYAEVKINNWANRYGPLIGVMDSASDSYASAGAFSMWVSEAILYKASGNVGYGQGLNAGDTLGILLDMDNRNLMFYKNGVSMGIAMANIPAGSYYIFAQAAGSNYNANLTANFGSLPFA